MCGRPLHFKKKITFRRGRERPFVRPLNAAHMAAGQDEVRRSDLKSPLRALRAWLGWVLPIPGSIGPLSFLSPPTNHCQTFTCGKRLRSTRQLPSKIHFGPISPRRCVPSCWLVSLSQLSPTFSPRALPPRFSPHCSVGRSG